VSISPQDTSSPCHFGSCAEVKCAETLHLSDHGLDWHELTQHKSIGMPNAKVFYVKYIFCTRASKFLSVLFPTANGIVVI